MALRFKSSQCRAYVVAAVPVPHVCVAKITILTVMSVGNPDMRVLVHDIIK